MMVTYLKKQKKTGVNPPYGEKLTSLLTYMTTHILPEYPVICYKFVECNEYIIKEDWDSKYNIQFYNNEWVDISNGCISKKELRLYPVEYLADQFNDFFYNTRKHILSLVKNLNVMFNRIEHHTIKCN